jgi:hypothetical protein
MFADSQLKPKVDGRWDRFWSGGIANPITAIESQTVPKERTSRAARFFIEAQLCAQQMV